VPEAAAFRVELLASRRAAHVRAAARWLTAAAAAACVLAFVLAPSLLRGAAAAASAAALLLVLRPARAPTPKRLAVDGDGTIRVGAGADDQLAAVRYVSRHLVCLATPLETLAVWPDSVSSTHWRRLLVACRWQRRRAGDGTEPPSGLRTK